MRRTFVLALAALALLGVMTPDAFAQAPTPTFKINGLIDQVMSYSRNTSNYDGNLFNNDKQWYGRTRGRLDFIGEVGKAKGVIGVEIDMVYGQTGSNDSTIVNAGAAGVVPVQAGFGTNGGFDLNTDSRGVIEVKWLYTEFEVPLIPVPTVARIGAQPFGSAASYKLAAYATGDFAGVNVVSTITPNVKINASYVAVEEALTGCQTYPGFTNCSTTATFGTPSVLVIPGSPNAGGIGYGQLRGDDFAVIMAPEITPIKGLDIKPMYSYFYASGTTSGSARQGRGGVNTTTAYTEANGFWKPGINENRHTVGIDARLRMGPFSLDPTIMYQFGNKNVVVPGVAGGVCSVTNSQNCLASASGLPAGSTSRADISAWLMDVRGGFQIGPLLLEASYMFTTGNKARDTTLKEVDYFQPLSTDTSYMADWGSQLSALGIDYLNAQMESGLAIAYPGVSIGWDKYGRHQIGAKATYFLTPSLSGNFGVNVHLTHRAIDTDGVTQNSVGGVPGGGLLPAYATGRQDGDTNYMGTELFSVVTWRFAPGLSWDNAAGYMFTGSGFDALTLANGPRTAKDVFIYTSRVRFTF
jgi:hypothetical protein